jgi:type I thyroxine 5'-deiodinase
LVDSIENTTEAAYTAWPDRLYVIDVDGRIAYKSDAGPFGFRTEQLSRALEQLVGREPVAVRK